MDFIDANTVLKFVVVLLVLVFLASIAAAVFTQYIFLHPPALVLWISRHWPGRTQGEEFMRDLGRGIRDTRKHSLSIWFVRISAIIMAIVATFLILWILGLHRILTN
jgi:hypothetical protein